MHDKGTRLTGTVGGWWVRADLSVQRTKAKAQSTTTWCGSELVYAAVQQENTEQCGYDHALVTRGRMRAQFPLPHGPCPSPPLVLPQGGVGDRHLVNPKFFVAAHCVVVWVIVLWGSATCIPCTHGRIFGSLSLKWNLTAQPCFPLGEHVQEFQVKWSRTKKFYTEPVKE